MYFLYTQHRAGLESNTELSDWEARLLTTALFSQQRWRQPLGKCPKHRAQREKGERVCETVGALEEDAVTMGETLGGWAQTGFSSPPI